MYKYFLRAAVIVLAAAVLIGAFYFGVIVEREKIYPHKVVLEMEQAVDWTLGRMPNRLPPFYSYNEQAVEHPVYDPERVHDGVNLVSSILADNQLAIRLLAMDGEELHRWNTDWFELWPDADHVPEDQLPKTRPGASIHGMALLPNSDIVFNFEGLGMMRLDVCGQVVWRVPHLTHHSVFIDDDGNIWTGGRYHHPRGKRSPQPDFRPPWREETIVRISPGGEILDEISLLDLLDANGLRGMVHNNTAVQKATGDVFHLNDVEVFPASTPPGVFSAGDVMVSLRHMNAILVFDPETLKIKFMSTDRTIKQHDPDFIDGNSISVFDNNSWGSQAEKHQRSRIVAIDARSGEQTTLIGAEGSDRFYTPYLGKHQRLDSGHYVISEGVPGRALEFDTNGKIVWQYYNWVEEGVVAQLQEVQRLPHAVANRVLEDRERQCIDS